MATHGDAETPKDPSGRDDAVRDEDRLPWLETVDDGYDDAPSPLRTILFVFAGLAVIVAAVFGFYAIQKTSQTTSGTGALIAAQEGDYKVKPNDPGGMKVSGEGDSAIATSDGAGAGNSSIDLKALPETPITGKKATRTTTTSGASKAVAVVPASGGALKAAPTINPRQAASGASGGALVQLGSFPSEAVANSAWASTSRRFEYLAPLGKSVRKAEVNGRTVYRLRVNAGSAGQAQTLCGKLKVAGEACFVANDD